MIEFPMIEPPMIERGPLASVLRTYLPRQRWYSGAGDPVEVRVVGEELRRTERPWLLWLLVDADGALYQVPLGLVPASEPPDFLRGHESRVLGEFESVEGRVLVYDAVVDPVLGLSMLEQLLPGESAGHVRMISAEQSNSSLVYDDRLIMKLFRRLHSGPNPDVEVTAALADAGFGWVAPPLAAGRIESANGPLDLAVVQPFLSGGVEAWALALNSLRGLFADHDTQSVPVLNLDSPLPPPEPAGAGGDFSADSTRLGETAGAMHLALAEAFSRVPGDAREWSAVVARAAAGADLESSAPPVDIDAATRLLKRFGALADAGMATRVHGDLHLGQVMRTDAGWYVIDFEGEPARPLQERRRFWSPLRDVAGMCRSFSYAAHVALQERGAFEQDNLAESALAWETRNRNAFIRGYREIVEGTGLLPESRPDQDLVLAAFELERALYELAYEQAYRPSWVGVPLAGIRRLLELA